MGLLSTHTPKQACSKSGGDFRLRGETAAKLEAKVREDEEQQSDEESAQ